MKNERIIIGDCPVCGAKISYTFHKKTGIYSCLACGYKTNEFTSQLMSGGYKQLRVNNTFRKSSEELRVYYLNAEAQAYYQFILSRNETALNYLKKRGFTEEDIKIFGFGYADGTLCQYLKNKGYSFEDMKIAGLVIDDEIDYFRHRITIPIKDMCGRILGFGARTITDATPKYLNTKETLVFQKRKVLFGIDRINYNADHIIVCEGYMDAITLQKYGFNAIAGMGTALTENQATIIGSFNKEIRCMYDSDDAGKTATLKNMETLQRYGIPCKWVDLSPYKDPDEFLKHETVDELCRRMEKALPRGLMLIQMYKNTPEYMHDFCKIVSTLNEEHLKNIKKLRDH